MLTALSIRDIVLVDALDLEVEAGLTVLTGETGLDVEIERVHQDDVADGEGGQHGGAVVRV